MVHLAHRSRLQLLLHLRLLHHRTLTTTPNMQLPMVMEQHQQQQYHCLMPPYRIRFSVVGSAFGTITRNSFVNILSRSLRQRAIGRSWAARCAAKHCWPAVLWWPAVRMLDWRQHCDNSWPTMRRILSSLIRVSECEWIMLFQFVWFRVLTSGNRYKCGCHSVKTQRYGNWMLCDSPVYIFIIACYEYHRKICATRIPNGVCLGNSRRWHSKHDTYRYRWNRL